MRRQIKQPRRSRWLISVASVAGLSLLLLVAAAPAMAKEFGFQGGGEPFDGEPIVGMTMTGKDVEKPKRVTGFTITGFDWICGSYTFAAELETAPIHNDPNPTVARKGIKIEKEQLEKGKEKDRVFKWKYELGTGGTVFQRYQLWGGQHRKHPKVWRGKFKLRQQEVGDLENACFTSMDDKDGFIRWEARYVGTTD